MRIFGQENVGRMKHLQAPHIMHFGIICVTEVNQENPWLNFEAGALAKTLNQSRVCPYLIGMRPSDLKGPLSQFQSIHADKNDPETLESIGKFIDPPFLNESG